MANEDSTLNLPESYKTSPVLELILERVTATSEEVSHLREEQKQLREDLNSKIDGLREDLNSKIDTLGNELREEMKTGFRVLTRRMEVVSIDMIELRGQQREVIEVVEKSIGQPT